MENTTKKWPSLLIYQELYDDRLQRHIHLTACTAQNALSPVCPPFPAPYISLNKCCGTRMQRTHPVTKKPLRYRRTHLWRVQHKNRQRSRWTLKNTGHVAPVMWETDTNLTLWKRGVNTWQQDLHWRCNTANVRLVLQNHCRTFALSPP